MGLPDNREEVARLRLARCVCDRAVGGGPDAIRGRGRTWRHLPAARSSDGWLTLLGRWVQAQPEALCRRRVVHDDGTDGNATASVVTKVTGVTLSLESCGLKRWDRRLGRRASGTVFLRVSNDTRRG